MSDARVIDDPTSEDWTLYEAISLLCSVVEKYAVLSGNDGDAPGFGLTAEEWASVVMVRTAALAGFKAGGSR